MNDSKWMIIIIYKHPTEGLENYTTTVRASNTFQATETALNGYYKYQLNNDYTREIKLVQFQMIKLEDEE